MARAILLRQRGAVARATLILWAFGLACVLVPALFFYGTWYGVRLNDERLSDYVAEGATTGHALHAVEEIYQRYVEDAPGMERWARALLDLSRREDSAVRLAAAWAMGEDASRPEFGERLEELLVDPEAMVRATAACSLARAGSAAGRTVLLGLLAPFEIAAPASGTVRTVLGPGERVEAGRTAATVELEDGAVAEVRAQLPGVIRRARVVVGDAVVRGTAVLDVGPDADVVLQAVTALGAVGTEEDLAAVVPFGDPRSGMPERVQAQARAAAAAIRARADR